VSDPAKACLMEVSGRVTAFGARNVIRGIVREQRR
jgi:hypothetical protein